MHPPHGLLGGQVYKQSEKSAQDNIKKPLLNQQQQPMEQRIHSGNLWNRLKGEDYCFGDSFEEYENETDDSLEFGPLPNGLQDGKERKSRQRRKKLKRQSGSSQFKLLFGEEDGERKGEGPYWQLCRQGLDWRRTLRVTFLCLLHCSMECERHVKRYWLTWLRNS